MSMRIRSVVCLVFLLFAGSVGIDLVKGHAQEAKIPSPTPTPRPSQNDDFGNVQVLKGVRDLLPTMHFIRASLGVRCDYCHVTELNKYRLDDKPAKLRAREMILMTRQLNETAFGGRQVITCNTCHRGSTKPVSIPKIATNFVNTTRVEPFEPPPPTLPTAEQLFAKFESASHIGRLGAARLRIEVNRAKLVDGGTPSARVLPRADRAITEAVVDGEKGTTATRLSTGQTSRVGSLGDRIWVAGANGIQWITAGDLMLSKRKINPLLILRLRQDDFASATVSGEEAINGVDAYVVNAVGKDGVAEALWFSKKDGLLLRRTYYHQTLLGPEPEQYDLTEYKSFGGIKLPVVINASYLDDQHLGVLKRLLEVKLNVLIQPADLQPPTAVR